MIKICCISSISEADVAINSGASAIGLVGPMPSGPGIIDNRLIGEIVRHVNSRVETFLLTSETSAKAVIDHHRLVKTSTIQLVDSLEINELEHIRKELPDTKLVQVIHVLKKEDVNQAVGVSRLVDMLLLDSGNPNLEVKELGGTGRVHDWTVSAEIVRAVHIPVLLAGGLNKTNVQEAIKQVQPAGVDVCSGVRSNNHLNSVILSDFVEKAKDALEHVHR